jgi:hypothetical protein
MNMKNSEMKSKVVTLANRLTSRMGGDKSAAFVKAWAIVKAGGLEIAVKGTSFQNRQEALRRLAAYAPDQIKTVLVPEPSNPVDPAAIAVLVGVQNGRGLFKLGYVPANLTPAVSAIRGTHTLAFPAFRVVSGTWGRTNQVTFGARLALGV